MDENKTNGSGNEWADLVALYPGLAQSGCREWKDLDGDDWRSLLMEQPQFADKCDWEKLDSGGWASLLQKQPQFDDKCDWEKIDGGAWFSLLAGKPQFSDERCWAKLDSRDLESLMKSMPEFDVKWDGFELELDSAWGSLWDCHEMFLLLHGRPSCFRQSTI
jgi:hypothetical protein